MEEYKKETAPGKRVSLRQKGVTPEARNPPLSLPAILNMTEFRWPPRLVQLGCQSTMKDANAFKVDAFKAYSWFRDNPTFRELFKERNAAGEFLRMTSDMSQEELDSILVDIDDALAEKLLTVW